jgi:NADPH:quinone reductase-like Zn-dependent oxidoreductase
VRAAAIRAFGGPDKIEEMELPKPEAGAGQLLVHVKAAGVGPWDIGAREGHFGPLEFPHILGFEAAGVIEAVAPDVSGFEVGEEVYTYCFPSGGYAEYVATKADATAAKPKSLEFVEAAAVPVSGLSAYQGVVDELGISGGQSILIAGAAGGVGTYAVQVAAAQGATVIAHARRENHDFLRELGADEVVDYRDDDWVSQVRAAHPGGVDALLDTIGGAALAACLEAVRDGGKAASLIPGPPPEAPRGIQFHQFNGIPDGARLGLLAQLIDAGSLRVVVQEVVPLSRAADAHKMLENHAVRGKVVLRVDE